ncbi:MULTISPECIES: glutamine--fructose-6-phosphate transaminase (isomerizing) [unclassified Fusibacter]|uniref:glutamine--fructose-6-phosphate transaminase (isomerizing) n=1 Tax=unclassified Fusibacter TaxID=2624464 RepID=UPI0010108957|nr:MULTISPECIES: glutamine--fructose-6-phosphate transaminase (isomerizing) [unclassified Fusibacter]MCK8059491.1 glutamine--fructose-6-phosphate transaminase (isomerizing) [Fusibacter sp. A2]NPE21045.1 glutamine--fructose-6-phosphate transaminase (isomerizing) [Fusibacter sp. A1]RXV62320.1 glutamine--fructose-6-phosphate transaminase (isomerizing) [Fusibacter sp. A1]
MCGIVGYIGVGNAVPVLLEGLAKLEYRGYDSAGVAILNGSNLEVHKYKGRLQNLADHIEPLSMDSHIGIGHTRWATHGEPSDLNAHPHTNVAGDIAVIHNGIIENYSQIKEWLIAEKGIVFQSETDTEVIAHLIDYYYEGNLVDAVYSAIDRMEGAYAIGVVSKNHPDELIAVRKDSPLVVGLGEHEQFIASDIPALLKYTKQVYLIENDEVVILKRDSVQIFDAFRQPVQRDIFEVTWDAESAEKEGYEHFTLKEIHEQPKGLHDTLHRRINSEGKFNFEHIHLTPEMLRKINKVYIVACGTAYHAGLIGKHAIEKIAKIPVSVEVASEFRYSEPFVDENTLFIAVSQSGETLDTLQSLREAKRLGARVLSIVNVVGSSVARDSDDLFYTWAGPEIGVASTKAFTTQLMAFYMLGLHLGSLNGNVDDVQYKTWIEKLSGMEALTADALETEKQIQKVASEQFNNDSVFFMGRGADVDIAMEASLKLKELSYINSFAIAAGELKHGTIALLEKGTLVIALATQSKLYEKTVSNIKEVKARGAYVVAIAQEGNKSIVSVADEVIYIPKCDDLLAPLLSVIPMQYLAYYVALNRGNDVDKPRNLAKSVTVE